MEYLKGTWADMNHLHYILIVERAGSLVHWEYIKTAPSNQLIGASCTKTMLYRGLGSGIIWVINEYANIELVNNESGNQFTRIIYREEKDKLSPAEKNLSQVSEMSVPSLSLVCPQLAETDMERVSFVLQTLSIALINERINGCKRQYK